MTKEELYGYWTKAKVQDVLKRLSCNSRGYWPKTKLVGTLCAQPIEEVLSVLRMAEMQGLLNKAGASDSGDQAVLQQRLKELVSEREKALSKTASTPSTKKDPKPLSKPELMEFVLLHFECHGADFDAKSSAFVPIFCQLVSMEADSARAVYHKIVLHVETGILVGFGYGRSGDALEITKEPFVVHETTQNVVMRTFRGNDGEIFGRTDEEKFDVSIQVDANNGVKERAWIEEKRVERNRRLEEVADRERQRLDRDKKKPAWSSADSMIEVPPNTFIMGALDRDDDADADEKPRHAVTLTRGFRMSIYPCTQELYEAVMGVNPSHFKGEKHPVECVSWCDAVRFCNRLSELYGLEPCYKLPKPFENTSSWAKGVVWNRAANGYRLPTEAEWEYCARAGHDTLYAGSESIDGVAWYSGNSQGESHPVGQKKANAFGLYDMSGNVWEWVYDSGKGYAGTETDPVYIDPSGVERIVRGGGWNYGDRFVRVSVRCGDDVSSRDDGLGFRLVQMI